MEDKIILALETATESCSVAIYTAENIYVRHQVVPQEHSKFILGMVDELLEESRLKLVDVDCIALGIGPGSFTGLRLAASVAQGLAFGANKEIIPISTLQALAQGAWRRFKKKNILATLDARMKEVYLGMYRLNEAEIMEPIAIKDRLWHKEDDLIFDASLKEQPWVAVGTAIEEYGEDLEKHFSMFSCEYALKHPSALDISVLAAHLHSQEGIGVAPCDVEPVYIRNKVVS